MTPDEFLAYCRKSGEEWSINVWNDATPSELINWSNRFPLACATLMVKYIIKDTKQPELDTPENIAQGKTALLAGVSAQWKILDEGTRTIVTG